MRGQVRGEQPGSRPGCSGAPSVVSPMCQCAPRTGTGVRWGQEGWDTLALSPDLTQPLRVPGRPSLHHHPASPGASPYFPVSVVIASLGPSSYGTAVP